jgi:hypothetical protein
MYQREDPKVGEKRDHGLQQVLHQTFDGFLAGNENFKMVRQ